MELLSRLQKFLFKYFPKSIGNYIGFLYGFTKRRTSFSQYGEDLILDSFIKKAGLNSGKILDIGAFHPVWYSNSYLLIKKGWTATVADIDQSKLNRFSNVHGSKVNLLFAAVVPKG
ncbi:MAG: hypothetical protein COB29_15840, partial [Sulfitobacter sp.]